jgi:hypothetical protein
MFYNEQGQEEGGLIYSGKATRGGQEVDVSLTLDQFRQDQNIYLHPEKRKDAQNHLSKMVFPSPTPPVGQTSKNSAEFTTN